MSFAGAQEKICRDFPSPLEEGAQEDYMDILRFQGENQKGQVQLEHNLDTAVKHNKNVSINTAPTKKKKG